MDTIFTIGYGNRPIQDFIELLQHYGIDLLVDTRSVPYSRFQANFRKKALQEHLEKAGIRYQYLGDALGGKHIDPDCLVGGQVDLDCLKGKAYFQAALGQVEQAVTGGQSPALMCAELLPQKCHRAWMLAPILEERGFAVLHIDERGSLKTTAEVLGWFR